MADEESSVSARGVEQREQEPLVQHQPDATERLATLMTQYMEHQLARHARGAGTSRQSTMVESSKAQTSVGSARPSGSRGAGSSRGRGSWRPPARPMPTRSDNTGGIVYYRCGVEGHMIRDFPIPRIDRCYQCGQPRHIARHCTQGPTTASSVGSVVGGSRGVTESARQG
ncbi:hypothetical protein Acr_00g0075110 [Actinidia rufa]|uniref:CCHC-type domain-containing protein n=1 Tax=Actinidia rufa TaxID=165716 RepID=A0A7J0DSJ9_9ERIC|nr:hypothetical protein Acr_00g0075110 [Actinidia rufa]